MFKLGDISAVIFDMDGLVLDTERTYLIAWQQAAETMGFAPPAAFWQSLSGLGGKDIMLKLAAAGGEGFDLPQFNQLCGSYWREYVQEHGIALRRGVLELLDYLVEQGLPYGLATNSPAANAHECLRLAGISGAFALVVTRDDVLLPKPSPDLFLTAAERLQVSVAQCLVLEDSHTGIVAAHRAGARSVLVPSAASVDPLTLALCDGVADDLLQVLALLKL